MNNKIIKCPTLYVAIKRPEYEDYYIIASYEFGSFFRPTCIDDIHVTKKEIVIVNNFTAENSTLKLYLEKLTEKLATETMVTPEEVLLAGLLIFDSNLETEHADKTEAYVFNSINIEERKNKFRFSSEDSYLKAKVKIDGEKVELLDEPVKCSNCCNLNLNVNLIVSW